MAAANSLQAGKLKIARNECRRQATENGELVVNSLRGTSKVPKAEFNYECGEYRERDRRLSFD